MVPKKGNITVAADSQFVTISNIGGKCVLGRELLLMFFARFEVYTLNENRMCNILHK